MISSEHGTSLDVYLWLDRRVTLGPSISPPEGAAELFRQPKPPPEGYKWVEARGEAIHEYFSLRDQITDAWRARDFPFVIQASKQTVEILDAVVAEVMEQEPEFWTSLPPAIEHGGSCMALLGDRAGLDRMHQVVAGNPRLAQWLAVVDGQLSDEELTRRILEYVRDHPGVIQKDLHDLLDADKARVQEVCWMANAGGMIVRTKAGRSYSLAAPTTTGG